MAFFMNNTTIGSRLRSHLQTQNDASYLSRRQFHTELGPREKALLADDPILNRYKSHNKSVRLVKRLGDVLTIVVVAGLSFIANLTAIDNPLFEVGIIVFLRIMAVATKYMSEQ